MRARSDQSTGPKSNLLVLNYAMDENSQVFSHQIEVVRKLADKFNQVYVITATRGVGQVPDNVEVIISKWIEGKRFSNSLRFVRIFLKTFKKDKNIVVFSHMTEVQSFLISPFTRLCRIKHLIWYAHASRSLAMSFNRFFVNRIVTSTEGSCPYTGSKVVAIGQAIDESVFVFKQRKFAKPYRFIHVGRLDPSKRLDKIINAFTKISSNNAPHSLKIVGDVSSNRYSRYLKMLRDHVENLSDSNDIEILKPISRKLLPGYLEDFQFFIHAFEGSLDKSIVEATMCGMPVLTLNSEYRKIFGSWSGSSSSNLEEEFASILDLDSQSLQNELNRRYEFAKSHHSFESWIENIYSLLSK